MSSWDCQEMHHEMGVGFKTTLCVPEIARKCSMKWGWGHHNFMSSWDCQEMHQEMGVGLSTTLWVHEISSKSIMKWGWGPVQLYEFMRLPGNASWNWGRAQHNFMGSWDCQEMHHEMGWGQHNFISSWNCQEMQHEKGVGPAELYEFMSFMKWG